jgi:hypothetical protein
MNKHAIYLVLGVSLLALPAYAPVQSVAPNTTAKMVVSNTASTLPSTVEYQASSVPFFCIREQSH